MLKFINNIQNNGLLTGFIADLFDYDSFYDYNYIFRLTSENENVIMDIYDNISSNRFNRYIFSFTKGDYAYKTKEEKNVFVTRIYIDNITSNDIKLHKLAYLFKLDDDGMLTYAKTFLDLKYVKILSEIINKPI